MCKQLGLTRGDKVEPLLGRGDGREAPLGVRPRVGLPTDAEIDFGFVREAPKGF